MSWQVYDFRKDIRNILVTPQIRARFLYLEPADEPQERHMPWQANDPHAHDLGHEIFLILSGRAEFRINGVAQEVGPGQMCYALLDEPHSVRVLGDEPVYMYLSVTPHIQPTHTFFDDDGQPLPPLFRPSSDYDVETDSATPVAAHLDRYVERSRALVVAAQNCSNIQEQLVIAMKTAVSQGDGPAAARIREQMWEPLLQTFKQVFELADEWNALAPRIANVETG